MPGFPWTKEELKHLKRLSERGHAPKAIYELGIFPGRSQNAIAKARHHNHLVDNERSRKTSEGLRRRLQGERLEQFIHFLRTDGRHLTSSEIAKQWRFKPRTVRQYRQKYCVPADIDSLNQATRRRQQEAAYQRHRQRQFIEQIERRKLQLRLEKQGCQLPFVNCKDCGESFFDREEFFEVIKYKKNGRIYNCTTRRCRPCAAQRRSRKWQRYKGKDSAFTAVRLKESQSIEGSTT